MKLFETWPNPNLIPTACPLTPPYPRQLPNWRMLKTLLWLKMKPRIPHVVIRALSIQLLPISSMLSHHTWPCISCCHSNAERPVGFILSPYIPGASSKLCFCSEVSSDHPACPLWPMWLLLLFPPPGSLCWCLWLREITSPLLTQPIEVQAPLVGSVPFRPIVFYA